MSVPERPLDQAHRRLEAVLNNATVAIFLMDESQCCIYMNPAAEDLTGYTFAEVAELQRPLHDIIHHTHPDGRPFPMAECPIDRAFPEHAKTQGRETFVHKDGSFYPVEFTASPIRDEASLTIGTVIEARNIANELTRERELQAASRANRLLLQEVNHRVKNSLQLVMSLLDMQAAEAANGEAKQCLKDGRNRVKVIASIHNRLYESQDYDRIRISDYIEGLVGSNLTSSGRTDIRLSFEGCGDFSLPISAAVSLALVISELTVNAIKHAFRDRGGVLSVKFTHKTGMLRVEVGDDGTGLPSNFSLSDSGALGMTLITSLSDQIGAKCTVRRAHPGTVFQLEVPCQPD